MPTGTDTKPFHPGTPPTRAELEAYLRGSLAREQARHVEGHLEADPLLREAMEGLTMPGAVEALPHLRRPGKRGWATTPLLLAIGALLLAGGAWWMLQGDERTADVDPPREEPARSRAVQAAPVTMQAREFRPHGVPSLDSLPARQDLHERAVALDTTVPREAGIAPLSGRAIEPPLPEAPSARPLRSVRSGRHLVFLHDLKLVDPQELYPVHPLVNAGPEGVDARYADRSSLEAAREPLRTMRYLDFMDRALGRLARNEHRGALEELEFLLDQYPDDVNARFYAALCSYRLGRYAEAMEGFSRVAGHEVDSFAEEARWYRALSTERAAGKDAARPLYEAVSDAGGFYAARARERLATIFPAP